MIISPALKLSDEQDNLDCNGPGNLYTRLFETFLTACLWTGQYLKLKQHIDRNQPLDKIATKISELMLE